MPPSRPLLVLGTHNKKKGIELVDLFAPLGLELVTLGMVVGLTAILLGPDGAELLRSDTTHEDLTEHTTVTVRLPAGADGEPVEASTVRLELRDLASDDVSHVHVYELVLS